MTNKDCDDCENCPKWKECYPTRCKWCDTPILADNPSETYCDNDCWEAELMQARYARIDAIYDFYKEGRGK